MYLYNLYDMLVLKYALFTLAVSTAMFVLDAGDNPWPLRSGQPSAVLSLHSAAHVVQLPGVDVGVDRDGGVVTGHAALVRYSQLPPDQVTSPLGAGEPKLLTFSFPKYHLNRLHLDTSHNRNQYSPEALAT